MANTKEKIVKLATDLLDIDAVKFGDFATKLGINTPIYFDFRVIVSYPNLMVEIGQLLAETFLTEVKCDHVCGVPYTALPLATIISVNRKLPMLMRRKELKGYGTKKVIEGSFKKGDQCLIIEDVVTSGSSVLETARDLQNEGLIVSDAIVILNREQGGVKTLRDKGIAVHSLFTMNGFLRILLDKGKIDQSVADNVAKYIKECQISLEEKHMIPLRMQLNYLERAKNTKNILAKELYELMVTKKTNLCVAADVTSSVEILNLAIEVGPHICILKLHVDILEDFSENFINNLKLLAQQHNFLLMEDRKYADIGHTVALQYSKGPFHTSEWADLVTAHSLPGEGVLKGLKSVMNNRKRGVFLVAEMSSEGNLISNEYIIKTNKLAEDYEDIVAGFVCQCKNTIKNPNFIQFTPGVQINASGDNLGQMYNSPSEVILEKGADVVVVGRGITKSSNPGKEAQIYKEILWKLYEERTKS